MHRLKPLAQLCESVLWSLLIKLYKFRRLSVLTELKSRGVQDMLIACVDDLKGFPDAIRVEYPQTRIQLCLVHMVRNSLRYVSWKDYKGVTSDLNRIYQSPTEDPALSELERLGQTWNTLYPQIAKWWTTNAVESLNRVVRAATKRRKVFPSDDSARKVIYLAIAQASKYERRRFRTGEWR